MSRKSMAALSIVAGTIDGRPNPPDELTEDQRGVWRRTVASEPADFFRTGALQALLKDYCRHVDAGNVLASEIDAFDKEWLKDPLGIERYDRLLKMRDRETKAAADKATKLRLTNQSRYTPKASATASSKVRDRKPWERAEAG